jgi:tetratricopeptide (TPR) repeat protein
MIELAPLLVAASVALAAVQPAASDSLDSVRQLYASADYESALATLERLPPTTAPVVEATEIARYRALCLIALGRTADAELALEQIVRINPSYQPDEQEAPRLRSTYASVRARVVPQVAKTQYAEAKAAYDRREYETASTGFAQTIALVDSLESADPTLGDLRTLATGFADLSRAAIQAAAGTAPRAPAATNPVASPAIAAPVPAAPEPAGDVPLMPPVVVQQLLPPWNPSAFGTQFQSEFRGAIEVTIDERGIVTSAHIVEPIHPVYDPQLLEAATRWRYEPARRGGEPVVSVKRVDIVLRPRS